jgi:hypothetical protein
MIDADERLLLPEGTRLLHIGPHKTGTTALQNAFHVHREAIAAQGVHYAGPNSQPRMAAHAASRRRATQDGARSPALRRWEALVRDIDRAREPRVVISSEGFADATPEATGLIVRDLDPTRLHVVVTLRPLANILPSQWQQFVQNGLTLPYEDWLEAIFGGARPDVTPSFWHRHRHDQLIARWSAALDPARLTVIVGDERDRGRTPRLFEAMVGLRPGTLVPEPDLANRSLTFAEVETVRAFNLAFQAAGLPTQLHEQVMRFGAAQYLKRRAPAPGEQRIETPRWALDRAAEVAEQIVAGIAESGVRVLGDLRSLAPSPSTAVAAESGATGSETPWAEVGARAAMGILVASGLARGASQVDDGSLDGELAPVVVAPRVRAEPLELARVSTPLLAVVLARRLAARLKPTRRAP